MSNDSAEQELTYDSAIKELAEILNELEGSEIDVDILAKKVERGNELLDFCSKRLEKVGKEVNQLIDKDTETK